jgi:hypothetical protein
MNGFVAEFGPNLGEQIFVWDFCFALAGPPEAV